MRKIAIVTAGVLPVPATKGGAVENLVEILLNENEKNPSFEFVVFSVADVVSAQVARKYKCSQFFFIETTGKLFCFSRVIRSIFNRILPVYVGNQFISTVLSKTDFSVFDAVILENAPQFAIPLRRKYPCMRIVSHLHNRYVFDGMRYQQQILSATDLFLGVSNYICRQVLTCRGVSKDSVVCLYNGIDTKIFSRNLGRVDRLHLRATLGIREDDFVFLFSGRLVPAKGIQELFHAFEIVRTHNPEARPKLLVIGSSGYAGSDRGDFSSPQEDVVFSGYINHEDMWKYLSLGDVAVFPSTCEEAFGLTCVEALCSGLPTIITNSGGMPEVPDDVSAVIVSRGDGLTNRLSNAMEDLMRSSERRKVMSDGARVRGAYFSTTRYWGRFCELINRLFV